MVIGKDMASDEEEEALNTLRIMPSAEYLVSAAEKISIYSPPLSPSFTPLHVEVINSYKFTTFIYTQLIIMVGL